MRDGSNRSETLAPHLAVGFDDDDRARVCARPFALGPGLASLAVGALLVGALGGFVRSLMMDTRWPTARVVGRSSGVVLAIAFFAFRAPLHLLEASLRASCHRGDDAACHALAPPQGGERDAK